MKTIHIGTKTIRTGKSVFIIAEAGVNHNGRIDYALKLVDVAKVAGADAVKFQTFIPEEVVTTHAPMAKYQRRNTRKNESQLDMIKKLTLSSADFKKIAKYCKKKGITFLSTPHSGFGSVDMVARLHVPAFKFSSADLTNLPVLTYAAKFKRPMIISTGMANTQEINEAVQAIRKTGNNKIVILQCTTDYPTEKNEVNINAMCAIAKRFKVPVGFSDHTRNAQAAIMAVTLGATVVEKHFTLDKTMKGPDHKASADPRELVAYVQTLRDVETILGSAAKRPTKSEKQYIPIVRKSLVARATIKKGEKFTKAHLAIKRPGIGLHPRLYSKLLGRKAKRDIVADEMLTARDL